MWFLKSLLKGVSFIVKGLTVEPTCFVFSFAFSLYALGAQRLVIQKACSPDSAPGIDDTCLSPELISQAADINTLRNVLGEALPGLLVFVAGSWRDASGLSRPLILYVICAQALATSVFLVSSQAWADLPAWTSSLLESGVGGLSGGRQLLNLAAVCYISNRSSPEDRTFRLTFYIVSCVAGLTIANAASGYVLSNFGYASLFSGILVLYLISFLLALVFIKEEPNKLKKGERWLHFSKLLTVFKPKTNRAVIWLMIINSWLIYTAICGESNLILFYLSKTYGFSVTESGIFLSYLMGMNLLSTLVVGPFLIKVMKWSDFSIGIFGTVSIVTAVVGVTFARSITTLCLFAAIDVMRYSVLTVQRSIITKCLPDNELGTYWSIVAIGEALMPMMVLPMYDVAFKQTIRTRLGGHYLVSAAIGVIAFVNLCLSKQLYKRPVEKTKTMEEEDRKEKQDGC